MKKAIGLTVPFLLLLAAAAISAERPTRFEGEGEIVTVDPAYGRVTIEHKAIKGFAGDDTSEFFVADASMLKGLGRRDTVKFTLIDQKGDVRVEKIEKTGVAPEKKGEYLTMNDAVKGALHATGDVAGEITRPIEPIHEGTRAVTGATTDTADELLTERRF